MSVEFHVISIGALSRNRLWGETAAVRTAHATTVLVRDGERRILVDPSLPGQVLQARYNERTGGRLSDVTDVFLTTLRPAHRRGLAAIPDARWWTHEPELETYRSHLQTLRQSAERLSEEEARLVTEDQELLERMRPAPEKFTPQVGLYPLIGPSPGSAGLLLTPPTRTVVVAGDAALTAEHVERGQIWQGAANREAALETLEDLLELADVIVPGHDNVMLAPRRWM